MGRINFCCCAFPLVNSGSYGICVLNFLMGIAACVIAFAPPQIVALMGVSLSWSKYLVGIASLVVGIWQIVGIIGIAIERYSVYRTYLWLHRLGLLVVFIPPIVFIIVAAVQHKPTYDACMAKFGYEPPVQAEGHITHFHSSASDDVAHKLCNVMIYAQDGCMAGLVALLAVLEAYFVILQTSYSHKMRDALADFKQADEIPLTAKNA